MTAFISTLFLCAVVILVIVGTDSATDDSSNHPAKKICDNGLMPSKVDNTLFVGGATAQAYKPNAPMKTSVCDKPSSSFNMVHKVAHWSFWRSDYKDLVPIFIKGNLLSCNGGAVAEKESEVTMEVWQPRPNGTYSSIRPGIEEGDCRASVPIATVANNGEIDTDINRIGTVEFETFVPGSVGLLNGLGPFSFGDYPPYRPGDIHMFLNMEGYQPLLTELSMSGLNKWIPKRMSKGRFKFSGGKSVNNSDGIEILSVTPKSRPGYILAIEVEVNLFLIGNDKETQDMKDVFCSHKLQRGGLSRIQSFFREPISVCSAAYMDFFAL